MKKLMGGVFNFVLTAGLVLVLALFGLSMVATGSGERRLAEAPEVKLSELAAHEGKVVRVKAKLRGEPALQAANGEALAFQTVTITHEESSGVGEDREDRTVTDYAQFAPTAVVAVDGDAAAGVVPASVDLRFVPERFSGSTGARGEFPAAASSLLPAGVFAGLPERGYTDLSVRAIGQDQEVTIHGVVRMVEGTPVLDAPEGAPFVVSPMPFDEVLKEAGRSGALNLVFGWGMVLGALAIVFFRLRGWLAARRAPAAA
ncbi:MAG: hypothetical protein AB1941_29865 [Gemmatimonadota bacterium]